MMLARMDRAHAAAATADEASALLAAALQPAGPGLARAGGLRYVSDCDPGISRQRKGEGEGFLYLDPSGEPICDEATLARIAALAIPPAYEAVWICMDPDGHVQATGRDARGRKQYRYHPEWETLRDATKYERMVAFGAALPRLRARVARDLRRRGLPRDKVLAAVVRLLDTTQVRVGSRRYARQNRTYGLTTLRRRHVAVKGSRLMFQFTGKSGVVHEVSLSDARLARVVRNCAELPGQQLFKYRDGVGAIHEIESADVNAYLHEAMGASFTAKDFRTWAGSVHALSILRKAAAKAAADTEAARKRHVVAAIKEVAQRLRNTVAVCRKCYVHPRVIDAFLADCLAGQDGGAAKMSGLRANEVRLLMLLQMA